MQWVSEVQYCFKLHWLSLFGQNLSVFCVSQKKDSHTCLKDTRMKILSFIQLGVNSPFKVCLYETSIWKPVWSVNLVWTLACDQILACSFHCVLVFFIVIVAWAGSRGFLRKLNWFYTQVYKQGWVAQSYCRRALGNYAVKPVHSGWTFRNVWLFSQTSISQILWFQLSNSKSPYESTSINHSATLLFSTPFQTLLQEKQNFLFIFSKCNFSHYDK